MKRFLLFVLLVLGFTCKAEVDMMYFLNFYYGLPYPPSTTASINLGFGSGPKVGATGTYDASFGDGAGGSLTSGGNNVFMGNGAGNADTTGSQNTAVGQQALSLVTTGSQNTALGQGTGINYTTENNNIVIYNAGVAGDSGVIRIGVPGIQTTFFPAGIEYVQGLYVTNGITNAGTQIATGGNLIASTLTGTVPISTLGTYGVAITNLINSFSLACSNLSFALGTTYTNLFVTNNYAPILTLSSNLVVNQGESVSGKLTNSSLTAGLLVVSDANKALASGPANSAGALMNNGSGTLSWGTVVTSVGIGEDANGIFSSWTGSPITTSGSFTPVFATENANTFFSGPSTGAAASPTFRAIVPADLPLATTSAFGAVKPDGTTVTITAGVISAVSSGGGASYITNAAAATVALSGTGSTNFLFPCYPTNTQIGTLPTNVFICTLTANCEFFAPTNLSPTATPPANGQAIRVEFIQDGTGNRLLTVATSSASPPYVKFGNDITGIVLSTNANAVDIASFQYNDAFTNWFCTGFIRGYGQ